MSVPVPSWRVPGGRRRGPQAGNLRPPGAGGARRPRPAQPQRRDERPPGQALRARGRRDAGRGRAEADRRDAAGQPRHRGRRTAPPHRLRETHVRIGIITFPGSLDDVDAARAVRLAGGEAVALWHADHDLMDVDAVVLPGGFSYGDYLRAGAIAARSPLMRDVVAAAGNGLPVLGICNGFQVLCEAGLLPGALTRNSHLHFRNRDQGLLVERADTAWTSAFPPGQTIVVPVKNGEGRYVAADADLDRLEGEGRVVVRYVGGNPNGSSRDIAGVTSADGRVVGLMPHPEHAIEDLTGPSTDGLGFFTSVLRALVGAAGRRASAAWTAAPAGWATSGTPSSWAPGRRTTSSPTASS